MKKNLLLLGLFFLSATTFAQTTFPKVNDKATVKKAISDLGVFSTKEKTEDYKPFK